MQDVQHLAIRNAPYADSPIQPATRQKICTRTEDKTDYTVIVFRI